MHQLDRALTYSTGRKVRSDSLVGFEHDPGYPVRLHTLLSQSLTEEGETCILGPVSVGEWNLHYGRIFIHDPSFLARDSARLLCSESAAVKASFEADETDLVGSCFPDAVRPSHLQGIFGGLGARGQQEHLAQSLGSEAGPGRSSS